MYIPIVTKYQETIAEYPELGLNKDDSRRLPIFPFFQASFMANGLEVKSGERGIHLREV